VANELILIVEDNPKNLKLVRDVLQVRGYRTIEAGAGEEGVQLARDSRVEAMRSAAISGKNHRATGEGAAEFRGTATKSLQNFGAPRSRLEIPEWFGRPYLRPYSVVAL
jgi:CheY-like chemotaxis protein